MKTKGTPDKPKKPSKKEKKTSDDVFKNQDFLNGLKKSVNYTPKIRSQQKKK